jgi:outer membrane lipoprotein carrier protein
MAVQRNGNPGGSRRFGLLWLFGLMAAFMTLTVRQAIGASADAEPADRSELKSVLGKVQAHYDKTRRLRAKFDETLTRPGAPERRRSGTINFSKPGKLRWEFAPPEAQLIVSDGTTLYTYDPDLNQVIETPLSDALQSPSVSAFLLGMGNLERDFDSSMPSAAAGSKLVALVLKPKKGGQTIELGIDPKTYDIVTFALTDQLGNRTLLEFAEIGNNVELSGELFKFTVPDGADIVRTEGRR